MRHQKYVLFILLISISILGINQYFEKSKSIDDYWPFSEIEREPSYLQFVESLPYIRSYFLYDHFDHSLAYKIDYTISYEGLSDKKSSDVSKILDSVINKTMTKYISQKIIFKQLGRIFSSEFQKIINQLGLLGIKKQSKAKITFSFTPQYSKVIKYRKVIPNQDLLDFSEKSDSLSTRINSKRNKNQKLKMISFLNDVPKNGQHYQYFGGEVTLEIDLSKDNSISKLLFRKYLRINQHEKLRVPSFNENIKIISANYKKLHKNKNSFITLDVLHKRNENNKFDTSVIYNFGDLLSSHSELNSLNTGNYLFHIDYKHSAYTFPLKFKVNIKSINYDLQTASFTEKQSIFQIEEVKKYQLKEGFTMKQVKKDLKTSLILSLEQNFLEHSMLDQFISQLELTP